MAKRVPYGGQAVIEGVMIRGRNNIAIAVRRPDNEIQLKTDPIQGLFTGTLKKVPLVRGFITLLEVMVIGTRALMYSAQVAIDEAEDEDGKKVEAGSETGFMLWATMLVGLAFGIAVFFVGPVFLNEWLDDRIRLGGGAEHDRGRRTPWPLPRLHLADRQDEGYPESVRLPRGRTHVDPRNGARRGPHRRQRAKVHHPPPEMRYGLPAARSLDRYPGVPGPRPPAACGSGSCPGLPCCP